MEQEQGNISNTITSLVYQPINSFVQILQNSGIEQLFTQYQQIITQFCQILCIALLSFYIGNKLGKRGILIDKKIRNQFETIKNQKKHLESMSKKRKSQLHYIQAILILLIIIYSFGIGFFIWQQAYFFFIIGLFKLNSYFSTTILFIPLFSILIVKYMVNKSIKNCEKHINQDDQYMQQYSDSIISKLGPNLVKFMKNTLLKHENEEFQRQKEALMKQFQKPVEQVEVQNTITKVIQTCSSDCKFEKKIFEKMIQKYQRFADSITSFAWCQICQGAQVQQINQDDKDEIPVENQNTICQVQCIQKYMQACKVIGFQYNKDDEEIAHMQNDYMMQKQIINQDQIQKQGYRRMNSK